MRRPGTSGWRAPSPTLSVTAAPCSRMASANRLFWSVFWPHKSTSGFLMSPKTYGRREPDSQITKKALNPATILSKIRTANLRAAVPDLI